MAIWGAIINRLILNNMILNKKTYKSCMKYFLYYLIHQQLKENIYFSVKNALTITDVRCVKNNSYLSRNEKLPTFPTNILIVPSYKY